MTLGNRLKSIRKILNSQEGRLTAREICNMYLTEVTTSDVLTTGTLLNVMSELELVKKSTYYKGKSPRYRYQKLEVK